MSKVSVIIPAAGMGTRMLSSLPKALMLLGGFPLIDHAIIKAQQLLPASITVVINPTMHSLKQHLESNFNEVLINYQHAPLGSGDAVKSGMNELNKESDVTLIIYVDTPLVPKELLNNLIHSIASNEADICIASVELDSSLVNYGRLKFNNNQLTQIIEAKDLPANSGLNMCNGGTMAIRTSLLRTYINNINNQNANKEYYLTDLVKLLTADGYKAANIVTDKLSVLGANNKTELAELDCMLQKNLRVKFLQQGVQMIDPSTVYFTIDTKIGNDVTIHSNVVIAKNTVIGNNVEIKSFSHIEGASIGNNCIIGPFARLRPETVLKDSVHIGNFVEIKKSTISHATKINHLSYVGNSNIGNNTNIGAGFISCNYDGANKYQTNIGSFSFIGSHVAAIAPVNIGNNVLIAAGSIITDDIPDQTMAIARSRQINKVGYNKKS